MRRAAHRRLDPAGVIAQRRAVRPLVQLRYGLVVSDPHQHLPVRIDSKAADQTTIPRHPRGERLDHWTARTDWATCGLREIGRDVPQGPRHSGLKAFAKAL